MNGGVPASTVAGGRETAGAAPNLAVQLVIRLHHSFVLGYFVLRHSLVAGSHCVRERRSVAGRFYPAQFLAATHRVLARSGTSFLEPEAWSLEPASHCVLERRCVGECFSPAQFLAATHRAVGTQWHVFPGACSLEPGARLALRA